MPSGIGTLACVDTVDVVGVARPVRAHVHVLGNVVQESRSAWTFAVACPGASADMGCLHIGALAAQPIEQG